MFNGYRPTWVEINLGNLAFNFRQLKRKAGKGAFVLAAVKANAYGHGMVEVCRKLEECGVNYLGVASIDEAIVLRQAKIRLPVLILGAVYSAREIKKALSLGLTITVADYRVARLANKCARHNKKVKAHIKIDTGMGRLGIWHEQAENEVIKIARLNNLEIEGIYTHFPCADSDMRFTLKQTAIFKLLLERLSRKKINIPLAHAANSAALCKIRPLFLNMARPGIMLYGMYPERKSRNYIQLKPVLSFKTKVTYLKTVESGRGVSYGRAYITKKKTRIATLPLGYADGYPRALSNRAKVLINGRYFPVAGRICMDQTMVDVGIDSEVKLGDTVVIIGRQGEKEIHAEELARICKTIPYEITCGISSRVRRVFKNY